MKRLFLILAAMCMTASVWAQHEIGLIAGGLNGVSYKYWWTDNMALQTDLAVGLTYAPGSLKFQGVSFGSGSKAQYDFTLNPNVVFHAPFSDKAHFFTGGGFNIGLVSDLPNTDPDRLMGKFGINAVAGIGFFVGSKIAMDIDFRPGYGLGFTDSNAPLFHFFDWKVGLAVRYRL